MSDTTANVDTAVADTATAADRYLAEFRESGAFGHQVDPDVRAVLTRMSDSVSTTLSLAARAGRESREIQADDTLYPAGRERLAREAKESARNSVDQANAAFDTDAQVADALLFVAARPEVPKGSEASARTDAMMLLDGALSREGASLSQVLKSLAGRQDAVGALVASEWLDDYAMARGMDPAVIANAKVLIRHAAMEGAASSGDPARAAAARAGLALRSLRQAQISARTFASLTLRG